VALLKRFSMKAKLRRDDYAEQTVRLALEKVLT
jgi:predicted acetyltransferase